MRFIAAVLFVLISFSFKNTAPPAAEHLDFPQDFFASPVNHPIHLTGNFGELRPDHFHSGIDIDSKTGGVGEVALLHRYTGIKKLFLPETAIGQTHVLSIMMGNIIFFLKKFYTMVKLKKDVFV